MKKSTGIATGVITTVAAAVAVETLPLPRPVVAGVYASRVLGAWFLASGIFASKDREVQMLRPSTLLRLGEDGVASLAKVPGNIARGTKRFARETVNEYKARQLVSLQAQLGAEAEALRAMTPAQRAQHAAAQQAIFDRADQIIAKRAKAAAPRVRKTSLRGSTARQ